MRHIRETLLGLDESKWGLVQSIPLRDPVVSLVVSILTGTFGIDRFLIGQTGLGIAKLLTCGGFFIWYFVDLFLIMGETKKMNLVFFNKMLYS